MKKIVCIGDSLTFGHQVRRSQCWPTLLQNRTGFEVINKGICGDTSGGMLGRFQIDVVALQPTHVIIMGGVNDLMWQSPLDVVKANLSAMVFQSFHYGIKPFLGIPIPLVAELARKHWSIMPDWERMIKETNLLRQWVVDFSAGFGCQYIDFYQLFIDSNGVPIEKYYIDGLHPTPEGNQMMAGFVQL